MLRYAGTLRNQGLLAKYSKKILRSHVEKPVLCILALLQRNVAATYLYNRNRDIAHSKTTGL